MIFVQVELDLTFLLNFSRKLFFIKNDVEMLFFLKIGFKIGVRIRHECELYTSKYGTRILTYSKVVAFSRIIYHSIIKNIDEPTFLHRILRHFQQY